MQRLARAANIDTRLQKKINRILKRDYTLQRDIYRRLQQYSRVLLFADRAKIWANNFLFFPLFCNRDCPNNLEVGKPISSFVFHLENAH